MRLEHGRDARLAKFKRQSFIVTRHCLSMPIVERLACADGAWSRGKAPAKLVARGRAIVSRIAAPQSSTSSLLHSMKHEGYRPRFADQRFRRGLTIYLSV